jgi:hypothetical protein
MRSLSYVLAASAATFALAGGTASANLSPDFFRHFEPLPIHHGPYKRLSPAQLALARQYWTPVKQSSPFGANGASTALVMTDGTVLIQATESGAWFRLTPNKAGSYIDGTWSEAASLPAGYTPLYYSSAVLPDGRLIVNGGEYNGGDQDETNLGAIYNPYTNSWKSVSPPSGWTEIGDAGNTVLANGTLLLAECAYSYNEALLDAKSLTWKTTGSGKADPNGEEGLTLLPNGNVLTVDVLNNTPKQSELYDFATGKWHLAANTQVVLPDYTEMGPQVLRPDGSVFAAGASGNTSVYNYANNTWTAGPTYPKVGGQQLDIADGPASLLLDGNVLSVASPGAYNTPSYFFEFDGTKLIPVPGTPNSPNDSSFYFRTVILPTGQILVTDGSDDVEIYTHNGTPQSGWAPTISKVATSLTRGKTYPLSGVLLNGLSQGSAYGDDAQSATNYPLVRITNGKTNHVFYARTHNHSSMAVASPATVSTMFDVPKGMEAGASSLVVVANGIPSTAVAVTVK